MSLSELIQQENALFRANGGEMLESYAPLNDLQRQKIAALQHERGAAYLASINAPSDTHVTAETLFTKYEGQTVYNFDADLVVPEQDEQLASLIAAWNRTLSGNVLNSIFDRITALGGVYLYLS